MAQAVVAVPGQLLGPADQYVAGAGTHVHEANLYSSLLGAITVAQPENANVKKPNSGPAKRLTKLEVLAGNSGNGGSSNGVLPTISVSRAVGAAKREVLPEVGNTVLCRVTRITPRHATVAILVVGDTVLEAEWQGMVRVQDVRATEKDRVKIYESFRPGDIVRAQVVSTFIYPSLAGEPGGLMLVVALDLARRPGQLLPLDCEQRTRRYHGHERGGEYHVSRQLEGV